MNDVVIRPGRNKNRVTVLDGGASLVNNHFASAEMLCPCGANL